MTLERILRDDDDMHGQTIREWKIEIEEGRIIVRMNHGNGFILMRAADVDVFVRDLARAQKIAQHRDVG